MRLFSTLFSLLSLVPAIAAQQYYGDTIPNRLPVNPGLELAYWRIKDPLGINNNLTLINYQVLGSDGKRIHAANVSRVVIMLNGKNRNAGDYAAACYIGLDQLPDSVAADVNIDTVAIVAPLFANDLDENYAYPYDANAGSTSNALVWNGTNWSGGNENIFPSSAAARISSFDVLDQMVSYYDDPTCFPNLKQIVIGGHSMGAAMVHRYAAVSTLQTRLPKTYWVANPNDYLWFNSSRPFSTSSCPTYNDWRYGFSNYYSNTTYNAAFVAKGADVVQANFESKQIALLRALQDMGDQSQGCAPYTQGTNRFTRYQQYIKYFPLSCEDPSGHNCDTIDYVNATHDAQPAINSPGGLARLFTDNFYGNNTRLYDYGWPRLQAGDDPYPNPTYYS